MFQGAAPSPLDPRLLLKSTGNFIELVLATRSRLVHLILLVSYSFVVPRDGSFHGLFRWYRCRWYKYDTSSDASGT